MGWLTHYEPRRGMPAMVKSPGLPDSASEQLSVDTSSLRSDKTRKQDVCAQRSTAIAHKRHQTSSCEVGWEGSGSMPYLILYIYNTPSASTM